MFVGAVTLVNQRHCDVLKQVGRLRGQHRRPGVNFMSQKLRGILPGGILLLTLIDSFLHFWGAQCMFTLKF